MFEAMTQDEFDQQMVSFTPRTTEEVAQGRFDTIEQLFQERGDLWWHTFDLSLSSSFGNAFGFGFVDPRSIIFNQYYSTLLKQILLHEKFYLLPVGQMLFVQNQMLCEYHPVHVFLMSLKIKSQEGLAWCDIPNRVKQESGLLGDQTSLSYKISNMFLNHLDNDVFVKFIEYAKPHPMLYYRVGILMMLTKLENSSFLETLDYSNLTIVRYLDDILLDIYKDQASIADFRKTQKYRLCIFNTHEQYYRERRCVSNAQSVITELVLENKVPRDVLKYIVSSYLM